MRAPWSLGNSLPLCALFVSILLNLVSLYRATRILSISVSTSKFSYDGDDYPNELALHLETVAMTVQDDPEFSVVNSGAWGAWRSQHAFPRAFGFVQLGPKKRKFAVAMFHQMHCLEMIRTAVISEIVGKHIQHCFNLLRQQILCAADITMDPLNSQTGAAGLNVTHVCRDWSKVYDFVKENQLASTEEDWSTAPPIG